MKEENETNESKAFKNALKVVGNIILIVIIGAVTLALIGGSVSVGLLKLKALINLSGV